MNRERGRRTAGNTRIDRIRLYFDDAVIDLIHHRSSLLVLQATRAKELVPDSSIIDSPGRADTTRRRIWTAGRPPAGATPRACPTPATASTAWTPPTTTRSWGRRGSRGSRRTFLRRRPARRSRPRRRPTGGAREWTTARWPRPRPRRAGWCAVIWSRRRRIVGAPPTYRATRPARPPRPRKSPCWRKNRATPSASASWEARGRRDRGGARRRRLRRWVRSPRRSGSPKGKAEGQSPWTGPPTCRSRSFRFYLFRRAKNAGSAPIP
mmetsp:Transcript_3700/g.14927  ORF Transcript_3700/g.14927 Transcript_3700/m.14927 type:complete len:266 (-) Transcript_3700:1189-1986(-)